MEAESGKKPAISPEQARQLLQSPEARQLMALLQQDGGSRLQQAAQALRRGDSAQVRQQLQPLLDQPQAARLLQKLSEK